jgi:DNA (cytosine-5)-methyltransferase 1
MEAVELPPLERPAKPRFCEFFAGGGMARLGLGKDWECAFANDSSTLKVKVYENNFGAGSIVHEKVEELNPRSIPASDLLWASFPCQDLSLAGPRGGIHELRSGVFWAFWNVVKSADKAVPAAPIVVLENVVGLLSSGDGKDFAQVIRRLRLDGYEAGAVIIDAARFLPHSRKRLFVIAVKREFLSGLPGLSSEPSQVWHPSVLRNAVERLSAKDKQAWLWWTPGTPTAPVPTLASLLDKGKTVKWDSKETTDKILGLMSETQLSQLKALQGKRGTWVGSVVMRRRKQGNGEVLQRAEVRFDGLANCLRTPAGGASIQRIIIVSKAGVRTRKMSTSEAARLMGLPDHYELPKSSTDAYQILGDGLAVPVVKFLNEGLLQPLAQHVSRVSDEARPEVQRENVDLPRAGLSKLLKNPPRDEAARRAMVANRGKNTKPELLLRRGLWTQGLRGYRKHVRHLVGKPDIFFPTANVCVFVHGCFWHGCPTCKAKRQLVPKNNAEYWAAKLKRVQERDEAHISQLESAGMSIVILWECELLQDLADCVRRVAESIERQRQSAKV